MSSGGYVIRTKKSDGSYYYIHHATGDGFEHKPTMNRAAAWAGSKGAQATAQKLNALGRRKYEVLKVNPT